MAAIRGRLLWYEADPEIAGPSARRYHEDGLIVVADGLIHAVGEARALLPTVPEGAPVHDHRPHLVSPGFIDPHIHFPQTQVIASDGTELFDWLSRYTFVEEQRFGDPAHAAANATFFLDELLRNGTTTACAFCTAHPASADALFVEAERRNLRLAAGKVMMDRGAPPGLVDTAEGSYADTQALIARWHGRGRLACAISPRFALTSTEAQLGAAGALAREHPDCLVQTHLAESLREIEAALALYPWANDYTAIYERFGLVGPRSLLGHCLHLSEDELARLSDARAVAVACPTSNAFLGSGLFDWARTRDPVRPVRTALATDVGGGTSYSMLRTAGELYKVLSLQGQRFSPDAAFHAITRANANALGMSERIGAFEPGRECDAVVLDAAATPAMRHRMERVETLEEELFVLMTMGDDRSIVATYVMGKPALVSVSTKTRS